MLKADGEALWGNGESFKDDEARRGALKGGRGTLKVEEEAFSDNCKAVKGHGDALKADREALDGDKKVLKSDG